MSRRTLLAAAAALLARPAIGDTPPSERGGDAAPRSIRFIAPGAPGDGTDRTSRYVAERVAETTGVPTLVENRPGADMILAVQALLAAPADGGTVLFLTPTAMMINPLIRNDLPYDTRRDIRPVAVALRSPMVLVTGFDSPLRSVADLLAAARARPGEVAMAHYAQSYRIAALLLARAAGVSFNMVPYKLSSQALSDVAGGTVPLSMTFPSIAAEMAKGRKMRALAVTGLTRNPLLPDVPTCAESGFPDFQFYGWFGFGVHGRTPEPVVQRTEDLLLKVLRHPDFTRFANDLVGNEAAPGTGAAYARLIDSETARYRDVLKGLP